MGESWGHAPLLSDHPKGRRGRSPESRGFGGHRLKPERRGLMGPRVSSESRESVLGFR